MYHTPPVSTASTTLVKVEDLWFSTEIIVIQAQEKIFRVLGGILAARSSVFHDMIALPQPPNSDIERIEGCPVVRLQDSAEDVEVFLRAIYDSSYFMPAPAPTGLSVVLSILRLSHKYDVQYLHRRALDHLIQDGWYQTAYDEQKASHLLDIAPGQPLLNALSIIIAAIEVEARWLLPYTYYCAATYNAEELLSLLEGQMAPHVANALAGHAHMFRAFLTINRFVRGADLCATRYTCDTARTSDFSNNLDDMDKEQPPNPIPADLEDYTESNLEFLGMCGECRAFARQEQRQRALAFWDKLPHIFGLPPWNELHSMKHAAMGEDAATD
ncbi:hypothetical protein C8R47DRAFT_1054010 [Mycena vitilis]|nr:hypothetical protein C8R47DRAFT_1054010 [Mycena vitilis]